MGFEVYVEAASPITLGKVPFLSYVIGQSDDIELRHTAQKIKDNFRWQPFVSDDVVQRTAALMDGVDPNHLILPMECSMFRFPKGVGFAPMRDVVQVDSVQNLVTVATFMAFPPGKTNRRLSYGGGDLLIFGEDKKVRLRVPLGEQTRDQWLFAIIIVGTPYAMEPVTKGNKHFFSCPVCLNTALDDGLRRSKLMDSRLLLPPLPERAPPALESEEWHRTISQALLKDVTKPVLIPLRAGDDLPSRQVIEMCLSSGWEVSPAMLDLQYDVRDAVKEEADEARAAQIAEGLDTEPWIASAKLLPLYDVRVSEKFSVVDLLNCEQDWKRSALVVHFAGKKQIGTSCKWGVIIVAPERFVNIPRSLRDDDEEIVDEPPGSVKNDC